MASTEPFTHFATASALRSHLVGAWALQSYMSIAEPPSTARPLYPMTKNVQGIIMYTPDGYMSAQISIPGQQKFEAATANEADWAECGKRYFAYSGPFFVTEEGGKVKLRHSMRIGNRPAIVGDVQLRAWRFEEDGRLLILSSEEAKEVKVRRG
jgi:Lipocalin-like domain